MKSKKEWLLSKGYKRETISDYDYLNKLSPDELAWLAEFNANYYYNDKVNPNIMGEELSNKMNDKLEMRKTWNRDSACRRDVMYKNRYYKPLED